MQGYLVLENGRVFTGNLTGPTSEVEGEVVFSTGLTGYQELFSDPSFAGQIVVMTYPVVGNYGFNQANFVSQGPQLSGLVIREACESPSHYLNEWDFADFLERFPFPVLTGVDTRALTRILRQHGTMGGVLTNNLDHMELLVARAQAAPAILTANLVEKVSRRQSQVYGAGNRKKVAFLDYGAKQGIIDALVKRGCEVTALPATSTAAEILAVGADGIFLSNGPGDPKACDYAVEAIRGVLGKAPLFGICLGHQLLGLALGADTYKLPFGHRGVNQPVKDLQTGRAYITSQNHGYAINPDTLPAEVEVSFINLNDLTVEGLRHRELPVASVQFHPEGFPGFTDTGYLFDEFVAHI
ncbi:MAG: glutamine-hydrolyzing carbamoyl-phosphate synthase small subunit [Methylocystaceae bacterium]